MKKKMVLRLLSLAMVASMTGTMLPSNLQLVSAEESVATEEKTEKAEETAEWTAVPKAKAIQEGE